MTPAQQYAYKIAETEGVIHLNELGDSISVQHVFELVLRLKQITNFDPLTGDSAKLDRLLAELEDLAERNGKSSLLSQWTKALDWLNERLGAFNPLIYHGGVPTAKREPVLNRFRDDPNCHLLLMSYGTGAVGLNLQFAGYVFLFDRWWNPAVEDQAINRAHRIGQKNPVIVTRFISKDTIEERIDLVLRQKRELFASVLGDGRTTNASLSMSAAEIFGLFDLKARDGRNVSATPAATPAGPRTVAPAVRVVESAIDQERFRLECNGRAEPPFGTTRRGGGLFLYAEDPAIDVMERRTWRAGSGILDASGILYAMRRMTSGRSSFVCSSFFWGRGPFSPWLTRCGRKPRKSSTNA